MKKFIFYALLFYALLFIALYVFTKLHSNENYNRYKEAGYIITLTPENITVSDPENGKVILTETYDSKSHLVKAILKDNEYWRNQFHKSGDERQFVKTFMEHWLKSLQKQNKKLKFTF